MLIKLVNATADLLKEDGYTRLELQLDSTGGHEATYYTAEGVEKMALRALPTVSDGWEDIAETGRMIDLELKRVTSITVGYKRCKGYFVADAGCEPHAYGDTLVDALRASLGPLPAPPSEE